MSPRLPALSAALACGAALALVCGAALAQPPAWPLAEVAPGVYLHRGAVADWAPDSGGDVANLAFVVGERCVAVIDTGGTPAVGQALQAAIRQRTPLPVCYVITTHAHPDHTLGAAVFRGPGVRYVGHSRLAAAQAARMPYYLKALQRDFGLAASAPPPPDVSVERRLELDLGGRVLQLDAWPTAHTDHDLTVFDRRTRTLFLGDLLFVEHLPVLDGSLRGWLQVLAELARWDVALAVPGHGPEAAGWPGALDAQRRYLERVQAETRAAIKARETIAQAVDHVGGGATAGWRLADRFHRRNVTAAYAELEWEE